MFDLVLNVQLNLNCRIYMYFLESLYIPHTWLIKVVIAEKNTCTKQKYEYDGQFQKNFFRKYLGPLRGPICCLATLCSLLGLGCSASPSSSSYRFRWHRFRRPPTRPPPLGLPSSLLRLFGSLSLLWGLPPPPPLDAASADFLHGHLFQNEARRALWMGE